MGGVWGWARQGVMIVPPQVLPGCSPGVPDPSKTVIHCAKFHIRPLRGERGARRGARGARGRVSERKLMRKSVIALLFEVFLKQSSNGNTDFRWCSLKSVFISLSRRCKSIGFLQVSCAPREALLTRRSESIGFYQVPRATLCSRLVHCVVFASRQAEF